MANTLKFKRGLVSGIPTAALGEPLFTTDTFDLYIGNGTGNTRFQKYIASGTTSQILRGDGSLYTFPLAISSPSAGQVLKYNGTSWVNDSDAGITGSGSAGQVAYFTGATTQSGSNNLFWDASNSRLGIGNNTPTWSLDIATTGTTISRIRGGGSANQGAAYFVTQGGSNTSLLAIGDGSTMVGGAVNNAMIYVNGSPLSFNMGGTTQMTLTSVGRLLLGSTSDNGLRFQVTGDGYFSGSVGIGVSSLTGYSVRIQKPMTGSTIVWGVQNTGIIQSDVTNSAFYYSTQTATQATTFTITNLYNYYANQSTFGAGSSVTNQYGFFAESTLIGATNNYGFYGNIASGTGRWNLYMNGTAANYVNGELLVGSTTSTGEKLQVTGNAKFTNFILVNSAGSVTSGFSNGINLGTWDAIGYETNDLVLGGYRASQWQRIRFYTLGTEKMRLDTIGNLGLGVVPSAWNSLSIAYQMSKTSALAGFVVEHLRSSDSTAGNAVNIGSGWYRGTASTNFLYSNSFSKPLMLSFFDGSFIWQQAAAGTANAAITFTQAMTLFSTGNLAVGTTTDAGFRLDVNGTMRVSGASTFGGNMTLSLNQNSGSIFKVQNTTSGTFSYSELVVQSDATSGAGSIGKVSSTYTPYKIQTANSTYIYNGTAGDIVVLNDVGGGAIKMAAGASSTAHFTISSTGAATFSSSVTATIFANTSQTAFLLNNSAANNDFRMGTASSQFRIVNAANTTALLTMTDAGLTTFSSSVTAARYLVTPSGSSVLYNIVNATETYTGSYVIQAGGGSAGYGGSIIAYGHSHATKAGWISSCISASSGGKFSVNNSGLGAGSDVFTVDGNGVANLTNTLQVTNAIAIGTTPDTNKPFKILKNINGTVGINFENTSTGALAFSAIQMGTDVTGGTKFTNLVYSSSGVTASGVYQPDGTSLINNGAGGLNFLGNPIRFYTGGSNGVLRLMLDNEGTTQYTATTPTTNATDGYKQYSADVVAGNAAPHFRTENGAVIKLYQETTAVGNAIFSQGGGNAVLDDSTFAGYTLRQIVQALRNQGILQ